MKLKTAAQNATDALRYRLAAGQTLEFTPAVLTVFQNFRQRHVWQLEAGGQLFAEMTAAGPRVVMASTPKRADRRSRFGFVPHRPTEQREIESHFQSGLQYVGDWHTHPEDSPRPSGTDVANINECFRQSRHDLAGFVLTIVGRLPVPEGLYVGLADGERLTALEPELPRILD